MKRLFGMVMLAMLPLAFTSCGDDEEEKINPQEQGNDNDTPETPVVKDIIVEVDANGNAKGGHHFIRIDDTNFYIDDIKYTASQGNLIVSGYDEAYFSGEANIITTLKYDGRTMNVTSIMASAFKDCTVLTSIAIPNSVTSIGEDAFSYCSMTSVAIGNGMTTISESAFEGCDGLTKAEFASVESLCEIDFKDYGANPLNYAHHLYINGKEVTDLVIPNSVTSIGNYAFYGCSSLTSIAIPNSVTSIGWKAFSDCYFTLDSFINNSSLSDNTKWGATIVDVETSEGLLIKNNTIVRCRPWATSITIPNSVTEIGSYAFDGCIGLTSVTIPNSVTSIGNGIFSRCSSIESIVVEQGNTKFDSRNGCNAIIKTATNTLIQGCKNTIIPYSVTEIARYAFYGCSSLTSIDIDDVTWIGNYAFYGCSSLKDVYCYATTPPRIDSYTFYDSYISSATLHVIPGYVNTYKSKEYWKNFGSIVAIKL